MVDSAMNVSESDSKQASEIDAGPAAILDRLEAYKDEHPECTEYWIDTELEAASLLIAMAAALKHARQTTGTLRNGADGQELARFEQIYRSHAAQGKALHYLRTIDEAERLELYGMRIQARRIVVQ